MRINQQEQLRSETDRTTQSSGARGAGSLKPLIENPLGVEAAAGETLSLTGEFVGETHRGLEHAQAHPPRKHHQKGPI